MFVCSAASRLRFRPVLTAVAIALGVWLGSSSTAEATCGDYLDHSVSNATGEHAAADFQQDDSAPLPCDGPDCRRAPESPGLPVPSAPPTFAGERWACLSGPAAVPPNSAGRLIPADELLLPGADPLDLERPPRSVRLVAPAIEA